MPAPGFKTLSDDEIRLAKKWYTESVPPSEIAKRLGRAKSTLTQLFVKQVSRRSRGRCPALTQAQIDFLIRRLDELIRRSENRYCVTAAMLKRSTRVRASERTILKALHNNNIFFRKLREKPVLTEADVGDRYAFAAKYRGKSAKWWIQNIHASIDGKFDQVYITGEGRLRAAQHATRGAYRSPGQGLNGAYVKPRANVKCNIGAKSALVIAAVGAGRMMMWHYVPDGRWNGGAAADMYTTHLKNALTHAWGGKRSFNVLEDNDPTGFKSGKGIRAKSTVGIKAFVIPKRSPELSVCDYAIWKEVNTRMRRQGLKRPKAKRESRNAHLRFSRGVFCVCCPFWRSWILTGFRCPIQHTGDRFVVALETTIAFVVYRLLSYLEA